jgi:acyl dehydratase
MEQASNVTRVSDANSLRALVGATPIKSDWLEIDQARVNGFADATGDHQWVHVDPERALRESPFGGPIAHGFLTLSLIVALLGRTIELRQRAIVNYGLNRVRFIAPVRVGARVRARFQVMNAFDVEGEGVQVVWGVPLEIEDGDKPAGVVEFITRHYF